MDVGRSETGRLNGLLGAQTHDLRFRSSSNTSGAQRSTDSGVIPVVTQGWTIMGNYR